MCYWDVVVLEVLYCEVVCVVFGVFVVVGDDVDVWSDFYDVVDVIEFEVVYFLMGDYVD